MNFKVGDKVRFNGQAGGGLPITNWDDAPSGVMTITKIYKVSEEDVCLCGCNVDEVGFVEIDVKEWPRLRFYPEQLELVRKTKKTLIKT